MPTCRSALVAVASTALVAVASTALVACVEIEPRPDAQSTAVLAVTVAGAGGVRSSPGGLDCGIACSASFAVGTVITLTATPAAGSRFTRWTGACSGTATTCLVMLTGETAVRAQFDAAAR